MSRSFFGHPTGLSTLFFTEMWERFSYYGMRAILILFMVAPAAEGGLGFSVAQGGAVQGTYSAMVYMMTMVGGWFADHLFGLRRSVFIGGVFIMLGHLSLALPRLETFYLGLVLVVIGTGFLKGNVSAMVGQLYGPEDARRDAGYSIYYMGVNLGGFLGPLVCGWLAQQASFKTWLASLGLRPELAWHFGFGAAAVGMFFGLIQYQLGRSRLSPDAERPLAVANPEDARIARRQASIGIGATAGAALVLYLLSHAGILPVTPGGVAAAIDLFLALLTIGFFTWLLRSPQWTAEERRRLVVILVLFLGSCAFWAGFEQAASTLNLFAQRNTANTVFGWAYPPSWLQSVNSLFIIILAPVIGAVWLWLGARDPSRPTKFTLGLLLLSASYALMIVASIAAGTEGRVSPMWLVGCYLLQTIGELSLSPVGMSAMSTLAPQRVSGLMMGVWFLSLAIGNKAAGRMGGLYESMSLPTLFGVNTLFVLIFVVGMALLIRPMKRMLVR